MNETLEEAVKRIALNEVGVDVKIEKLLGTIVYPSIKNQPIIGWPIGVAYLVTIKSGKLRGSPQGLEVGEFHQIPERTILEQRDFINEQNLI